MNWGGGSDLLPRPSQMAGRAATLEETEEGKVEDARLGPSGLSEGMFIYRRCHRRKAGKRRGETGRRGKINFPPKLTESKMGSSRCFCCGIGRRQRCIQSRELEEFGESEGRRRAGPRLAPRAQTRSLKRRRFSEPARDLLNLRPELL